MSLRDIFLFIVLAGVVVTAPRRPFIGALAWVLFGVMNPHRLTWGLAYDFPFSQVIAIVTLLGLVMTRGHRKAKGGAAAALLLMFFVWNCFTTLFAFQPLPAWEYLMRVFKVYMMTFVLLLLMRDRRDVFWLVATLALSLGFYGTKGGMFVVATGGSYMVNGPPDSPMDGNNALGVGLTMVIPLMYFLYHEVKTRWIRWALILSMSLCAVSVLGAYSRGAMLAIGAMSVLLWVRSRHKGVMLLLAAAFIAVAIPAMPDRWFAKMHTLEDYDHDDSALFRLYTWQTATNIAKDRFPVGGGFEWESPAASAKYSPLPTLVLVAHSIYFQVIGSQGFVGLLIYLTFWVLVWRQCAWLRRQTRDSPELQWAFVLGSMVQVALVGYAIGGAFLDLAFWDLPYYLYAAVAAARYAVQQELRPVKKIGSSGAVAAPLQVGSVPLRS